VPSHHLLLVQDVASKAQEDATQQEEQNEHPCVVGTLDARATHAVVARRAHSTSLPSIGLVALPRGRDQKREKHSTHIETSFER
jgi:hypothetical protein